MQPMRLCIRSERRFEVTYENTLMRFWQSMWTGMVNKCNQCDFASKRTLEKSQTNETNVTMPFLTQLIWGHIWKYTVEKSQANTTFAFSHAVNATNVKSWHQLSWILLKIASVKMVRFPLYENKKEMMYEPCLLWQTALQPACSRPLSWGEAGCRHSGPPKFCSEGSCCGYPRASMADSSETGPEKKLVGQSW